jgi:hypothetical protein
VKLVSFILFVAICLGAGYFLNDNIRAEMTGHSVKQQDQPKTNGGGNANPF